MTRNEAFIKLVEELGFDPAQVTNDARITDDHEHGRPRLHLSLIVPITRDQVDRIRIRTAVARYRAAETWHQGNKMSEPTAEQCNGHAELDLGDGQTGWACWYPQMGGYVGKAVIVRDGTCLNVYVWHDGDFPFSGDDAAPRELHHCDGTQFVDFGNFLTYLEHL